jgi:predicted GH43/DUF377 family glycosyl hydrolase
MNKLYPFKRYKNNPILSRDDVPYPCNTVFNAGACIHQSEYFLLLRIENLEGYSHLTLARSKDGYKFEVDPQPCMIPSDDPQYEIYERFGVEDPRITCIEDTYYITYTAYGPFGTRVAIGATKDFVKFERISLASETNNKDAVLFPEKINDNYVMIDRPDGMGAIWMTYSKDLIDWGRARVILAPEPGWGPVKLGISTPPIKTEQGWLCLYHGVRQTASGRLYRIGAILLDLNDPSRIIGQIPHFIFGPEEVYERTGDVPNVVFPCGIINESNGVLKMYYGAADTCIALAESRLEDVLNLFSQGEIQ